MALNRHHAAIHRNIVKSHCFNVTVPHIQLNWNTHRIFVGHLVRGSCGSKRYDKIHLLRFNRLCVSEPLCNRIEFSFRFSHLISIPLYCLLRLLCKIVSVCGKQGPFRPGIGCCTVFHSSRPTTMALRWRHEDYCFGRRWQHHIRRRYPWAYSHADHLQWHVRHFL